MTWRRLANAATLVTLLTVLAVSATAALVVSPRLRSAVGVGVANPSGYEVGQRIDVDTAVFREQRRTAVLFLRSRCPACQDSSAILRQLVDDVAASPDARAVIVAGRGELQDELTFAAALGVRAEDLVPVNLRKLRVRRVPSVVLVDRAGTVLFATSGKVSEQDRQEVRRLIATP